MPWWARSQLRTVFDETTIPWPVHSVGTRSGVESGVGGRSVRRVTGCIRTGQGGRGGRKDCRCSYFAEDIGQYDRCDRRPGCSVAARYRVPAIHGLCVAGHRPEKPGPKGRGQCQELDDRRDETRGSLRRGQGICRHQPEALRRGRPFAEADAARLSQGRNDVARRETRGVERPAG